MANHNVAVGKAVSNAILLTANTTDSVNFEEDPDYIEVVSNGVAELYVTVDGSEPVIGAVDGGSSSYFLPATLSKRVIAHGRNPAPVKLRSAGAPTVSVSRI